MAISCGCFVHCLDDLPWDWTGNGIQVTQFLKMFRTAGPNLEDIAACDIDGTFFECLPLSV